MVAAELLCMKTSRADTVPQIESAVIFSCACVTKKRVGSFQTLIFTLGNIKNENAFPLWIFIAFNENKFSLRDLGYLLIVVRHRRKTYLIQLGKEEGVPDEQVATRALRF